MMINSYPNIVEFDFGIGHKVHVTVQQSMTKTHAAWIAFEGDNRTVYNHLTADQCLELASALMVAREEFLNGKE